MQVSLRLPHPLRSPVPVGSLHSNRNLRLKFSRSLATPSPRLLLPHYSFFLSLLCWIFLLFPNSKCWETSEL